MSEEWPQEWPHELPVAQVRVARPTDRLEEVVAFYRDGIGLPVIGAFEGHAGYSGVMLGLPRTAIISNLPITSTEAIAPLLQKTICWSCISPREPPWTVSLHD